MATRRSVIRSFIASDIPDKTSTDFWLRLVYDRLISGAGFRFSRSWLSVKRLVLTGGLKFSFLVLSVVAC